MFNSRTIAERVQNAAARLVLDLPSRHHVSSVLKENRPRLFAKDVYHNLSLNILCVETGCFEDYHSKADYSLAAGALPHPVQVGSADVRIKR